MQPPVIPKRLSSLLSVSGHQEVNSLLLKREFSQSQVSLTSSTDEFLEAKLEQITTDLNIYDVMKKYLSQGLEEGRINRKEYNEAVGEIDEKYDPAESEMIAIKRQRKILKEDIQQALPRSKIEELYTSLIRDLVMGASAKQKKASHSQQHFRASCFKYYEVDHPTNPEEAWCHLTGWHPKDTVTAAHIVPKSLQSDELAYFFGAGYIDLMQARNALMLEKHVEIALDTGRIVIVPLPSKSGEEIQWKCIVTQKSELKNTVYQGVLWKDLHGKELEFKGPNRPAKRYLYFRYLITYLHWKKLGSVEFESEVAPKGVMWASPGNYVRESMLRIFAKKVGDYLFPEAFYEQTTFSTVEGGSNRPKEEEELLATVMAHRVKSHKRNLQAADDDVASDEEDVEDEEN